MILYFVEAYMECFLSPFQRGVYFSDLTSEESRKLFRKFLVKWNKGVLGKVCRLSSSSVNMTYLVFAEVL